MKKEKVRGKKSSSLTHRGERVSCEDQTLIEGREKSVELRFVAVVQDLSQARSWKHAQFQQMAPRDERGGGLVFNFQSARTLQQPAACRKPVKGFWRAASVIGPCDPHQSVDPFYLLS
jgi:hypothetical protein